MPSHAAVVATTPVASIRITTAISSPYPCEPAHLPDTSIQRGPVEDFLKSILAEPRSLQNEDPAPPDKRKDPASVYARPLYRSLPLWRRPSAARRIAGLAER